MTQHAAWEFIAEVKWRITALVNDPPKGTSTIRINLSIEWRWSGVE